VCSFCGGSLETLVDDTDTDVAAPERGREGK
jgi:hypothetical protein